MPGGFQTQVTTQPAPAVAGDFASSNPRFNALAGPGGFVTGSAGVAVGLFCWAAGAPTDPNSAPQIVNNFLSAGALSNSVLGFVHREQQATITTFLAGGSMVIPAGYPLTVFSGGDFWVKNNGAGAAYVGQKAYATFPNGQATFAATGTPTQAFSITASIASTATLSCTGSITGSILTVTAVSAGTLVAGETIAGTNVVTGTQIVSQITPLLAGESTGGIGRYYVSIPEQTVSSTAITGTFGTMTVTAVGSGTIVIGDTLVGGGGGNSATVAGTMVTQFLTGTGGTGTYVVNNNTVVTSGTITANANIETKWIAMSAGAAGELIKITDHALG